jgi:dipicolinate synthase subunit A
MLNRRKYAVIGGDMRNVYLAELLKKDYQYVEIYGFEKSGKPWAMKKLPIDFVLDSARIIVGGIPLLKDNNFISTPLSNDKLSLNELLEKTPSGSIMIAGKIPDDVKKIFAEKNVKCADILDREEMAVLNAVPSAEGAIHILLQELIKTIKDSRILILGYGRIGKILSNKLQGLGAEVWAAARKYSDLAWIEALGLKPVPIKQLIRYVWDMDAIVNTVPALILTREVLEKVRNDCFLLDLASVPGGIDFKAAQELGFKVQWALGLPGKIAPLTSGDIIRRTIYNIIEEEGGIY